MLAANQLGFSPNLLARSLTTRKSSLIGLVSNNFHNPAFLEVFDLFTREIQARGFRPLIVNLTPEMTPERLAQMMAQYSADGVILASSTLSADFDNALQAVEIPVVQAFGRVGEQGNSHRVGIDNRHCGQMAAEHLLALGYRRLAFIGGPEKATTTIDRWLGFRAHLAGVPGVTVSHSFASDYSFEAGRQAMQALLQEPLAEAYFCGDDVLSIGAISAIRAAGLSVPGDVGVLGVNDIEMAGWAGIDLTTIRQPLPEIIGAAVDLIVTTLKSTGGARQDLLFECRIIERGTLRLAGA